MRVYLIIYLPSKILTNILQSYRCIHERTRLCQDPTKRKYTKIDWFYLIFDEDATRLLPRLPKGSSGSLISNLWLERLNPRSQDWFNQLKYPISKYCNKMLYYSSFTIIVFFSSLEKYPCLHNINWPLKAVYFLCWYY